MTCTPDPVTAVALQAALDDAVKQYHLLITGQSARVVVDQNGQRVEFTAANSNRLNAYIMQLKSQLGIPMTPCSVNMPSAPAGFYF